MFQDIFSSDFNHFVIMHAKNGGISTFGLKSDITIFLSGVVFM